MSSAATDSRFDLTPPGPGTWVIDAVHFPRPGDALLGGDASRAVQARLTRS